ncbi:metal ABC transporter substrate-binding protein [Angustibacter sp. McL0619]|uniref:metal ABC transporter substrate-binding protein n=1 Tax=Angustibacter sp. McL0619 TaxID=3415676 RepID=UPI003CF0F940
MTKRRTRAIAGAALLALAGALALSGCSSEAAADSSDADGRLRVTASFYPLQYIAQRIGGDAVRVASLTRPGAEPHDLELTPRDVAHLQDSDLVVYLSGFQPAVDDGIVAAGPPATFDAAPSADLNLTFTPVEQGQAKRNEAGSTDPHFWLDPTRLSSVAAALEAEMARLRPADAADFATNLAALRAELDALDADYRKGLSQCANPDLVTSHNAFGYLAQRYGLRQVPITGLTPEAEPQPRELADVIDFVEANDVRTIYYETLVSPAVADTVARETGAAAAVLDPIEGLTAQSAGTSYFEVMRANLASLRHGQPCR